MLSARSLVGPEDIPIPWFVGLAGKLTFELYPYDVRLQSATDRG
jgi:hypothetical protein